MAPVKKTPNTESKPETKPKAIPAKAPVIADALAIKKAAGTPKKASVTLKKATGKSTPAPLKTKPVVEKNAQVESTKKGVEQKKSVVKAVADKPSASASMTSAPKAVEKASGLLSGHVEAVLQAVKEGKAIELIFRDAEADPPRTFEPRQLIFDALTQAWFVWGWDRRYNAERHHQLDHMAEINLVDGPGRSAQGPYKEGTPANLIGGWLGGEPIHVKATMQKQWIFAVKQAPPAFPEFKIEDGEDGKATVSFVATDLRAIARWCLQFGEGIQVLEPQRLVDRIKQVGVAWVGKPLVAAPAPTPRPAPQLAPRPEHKPEHKSEHKSEHRREHGKDREENPKKGSRVEIRIEKL